MKLPEASREIRCYSVILDPAKDVQVAAPRSLGAHYFLHFLIYALILLTGVCMWDTLGR